MIYTVTFNPSIDYFISVPGFELGKTNRTEKEVMIPGGKGINVSLQLVEQKVKSTALGFVAGYTGKMINDYVTKKGIDTDFIRLKRGNSRINVKFTNEDGTEINGIGPAVTKDNIVSLMGKLSALKDGDILVLSGSIPASLPSNIYSIIMEYLKDKDIKIIVDATRQLLTETLKYKPFLIKPNHHELGEIFFTEIETFEDAITYGKKMQDAGARNVIVSMGSKGSVFIDEFGKAFTTEAVKTEIVSSVGAGDSMVAGFIAGYTKTGDLDYAYENAVDTANRHIVKERK